MISREKFLAIRRNNHQTALVALSKKGLFAARRLSLEMDTDVFAHKAAGPENMEKSFERIMDLTQELFQSYRRILYIAPSGAVVRAIAPCLRHKAEDPAVVVVDIGARWAISLLSGHEGGANELAFEAGRILGCEPVITTSLEAEKDVILGLGCRKGVRTEDVLHAVELGLKKADLPMNRVRIMASADIKKNETGLVRAAQKLGVPMRFIPSQRIKDLSLDLTESDFVREQTGLPGVAEPCALLAGSNTRLVLGKTICRSVTIAVARESLLWSE